LMFPAPGIGRRKVRAQRAGRGLASGESGIF
jgi:hypothetical protein